MRALSRIGFVACLLVALVGCAVVPPTTPSGPGASSAAPRPAAPVLERLLREIDVVDEIGWQPGYDRACDPGACVFGPAWTDDHDGVGGHNGCDTRQDVLLRQMRDIELRWGSKCRIYEARLTDPYTGEELTWRDDGYWIAVDHVYPLARAWRRLALEPAAPRRLRQRRTP